MKRRSERSRKQSALLIAVLLISCFLLAALAVLAGWEPEIPALPGWDDTTESISISFPEIPSEPDDSDGESSHPSDSESESLGTDELPPITFSWEPMAMSDSVVRDGETLLFASVNRPVISLNRPDAEARLNQTLTTFCDRFVRITEEDRTLAEEARDNAMDDFEPHERSGDSTVYRYGDYLSILFNLVRDTGGADISQEKIAFVFDLETGERVNFAEFIGQDEAFGRDYIKNVFGQMIHGVPDTFYSDAEEILTSSITLYEFYLEKDHLVLFFNPDVISPSAHGLRSLEIPYSLLGK